MMMRTASRVLARLVALAVLVPPVMGRELESGFAAGIQKLEDEDRD